jgi:AcrR family transcriptional regulator
VTSAPDPMGTPARAGRPRDSHLDAAILDATDALLDESGYSHLTLEEVARRAGTTRPAIRRRWSSRPRLVLAALSRRWEDISVPETGCTLCDLFEGITVFVEAFDRVPPDVLDPLLADCAREPELRAEFMSTLFDPPRATVAYTLDRAFARGDLRADLDRELAVDLLGSLVHYRALFGHAPLRGEQIESAVETLLRGIATDYPALVEHSLRAGHPQLHGPAT